MSKQTFFPFRVELNSIQLKVDVIGAPAEKDEQGRIHAYRLPGDQVRLKVTATLDETVLRRTLPATEQAAPPVAVLLTLRSVKGRQRQSRQLLGFGEYEDVITLQKDAFSGTLELQAHLVRTKTSHSMPRGYAKHQATVVATSSPQEILFDAVSAPPVGGVLDVRWEEFATSTHAFLQRQKGNLFALDAKAEVPILYLNSGIQWATDVLGSEATSGRAARQRDFTNAYIAQKVWTVLLVEAMQNLAGRLPDEDEADVDELPSLRLEAVGELPTWQKDVLAHWAPTLTGQDNEEKALKELCALLAMEDWPRELVTGRLPDVLQQALKTGERFTQVAGEVFGS